MVLSGEGATRSSAATLFPQGPERPRIPRGDRAQGRQAPLYDCCGPTNRSPHGCRGTRAVPRQGVSGRGHAHQSEAKMAKNGRIEKWILRKAFEELLPKRSSGGRRSSSPTAWATVDRHSETNHLRSGLDANGTRRRAVPDQSAATRRSTITARSSKSTSRRRPQPNAFPRCLRGVQHRRGAGLGRGLRDRNDPSGRAVLGVHNTD